MTKKPGKLGHTKLKAQAASKRRTPKTKLADLPKGEPISLCVKCAKHPRLQEFVKANGGAGYECGICHRSDQIASVPAVYEALCSLVRALFRYYYDEWLYNGHWGGDHEPAAMLAHRNKIIRHTPTDGFTRSPVASELFLMGLFDPPYPDYDKGIAVYAGHHEDYGRLPPLRAIGTSDSAIYAQITDRLKTENHFDVEGQFESELTKFDAELAAPLPSGTVLYRARIGYARRFLRGMGWTGEIRFQPHTGTAIGAPPPPVATSGRLNRHGVSFLYLATDETTAAAEIRPHPGHYVSIGAFRCVKDLRVVDFSAIDIGAFSQSDERLDLFHLGETIGREISLPITPEERHKYSVTQLLSEITRRRGYDGIRFRSSVARGFNYCIFQPGLFAIENLSGKVIRIKGLQYEVEAEDHLLEPTDDDVELPASAS